MESAVKSKEYPLFGAPPAVIEIYPRCVEPPAEGDGVCAEWRITLPPSPHYHALHEALRFDGRVSVGGHSLNHAWGGTGRGCRCATGTVVGDTWREAYDLALAMAEKELEPLLEACAARAAAHSRHGDPDPMTAVVAAYETGGAD